jgi:hypothetical protein
MSSNSDVLAKVNALRSEENQGEGSPIAAQEISVSLEVLEIIPRIRIDSEQL